MKRKGFTLIELLAVIVVLAIIALIATPIVMNTIKNAKKGAAERSADNYIKQVETTIAEKRLENNPLADGPYTIDGNGNLTGNGLTESVTIDMSGTKPSGGTVTISNGLVSKEGTTMTVGDYDVKYNQEKNKYEAKEKGTSSTEVLCKANTEQVTALVWNGTPPPTLDSSYTREKVGLLASEATSKYDIGVTYTCELGDGEQNTFYVLETNGDNVSLILGMNLGNEVAWSEDGNNHKDDESAQAVTAKATLKERTSAWTKLNEGQITLPTGQQIATAGGDTKWNNSTYGNGISSAKWLCSYTDVNKLGYWTSSPTTDGNYNAWLVHSTCTINSTMTTEKMGIRPVITISKSQLD